MSNAIPPFLPEVSGGLARAKSHAAGLTSPEAVALDFQQLLQDVQSQQGRVHPASFAETGTLGRNLSFAADEPSAAVRAPTSTESHGALVPASTQASQLLAESTPSSDAVASPVGQQIKRPGVTQHASAASTDPTETGPRDVVQISQLDRHFTPASATVSAGDGPADAVPPLQAENSPGTFLASHKAMSVAVWAQLAEEQLRFHLTLPSADPAERQRLKSSAMALLSEFGLQDADLSIHEISPAIVTRKRDDLDHGA